MFIEKLGMKTLRGCKALINTLTHSKGIVRSASTHSTDNCGLALKTLESDAVTITHKGEKVTKAITKPTIPTAPAVFEGSQVSMHHGLNGINTMVREAYRATKSGKTIDADDMFDVVHGLPRMLKIDKEFAKLPPLEKECIVWRGRFEHPVIERFNQDFKIIDNAKIGDVITPDTGYSYTGFTKELASHWSNSCDDRTMMFKIKLPKGAKVSRNLEHGGEVVMPRNAEYRLLSKSTNGNHTEVELEYILPKKDNVTEIEELIKKFNIEPA